MEQLADDHWHLMRHLKIAEFGVVGLSVGGMWGTHLALKYPDAVRALVLMDTFVGSEPLVTNATLLELPKLNHLFQTCQTGSIAEYAAIEETIAPSVLNLISDWILDRTVKK